MFKSLAISGPALAAGLQNPLQPEESISAPATANFFPFFSRRRAPRRKRRSSHALKLQQQPWKILADARSAFDSSR